MDVLVSAGKVQTPLAMKVLKEVIRRRLCTKMGEVSGRQLQNAVSKLRVVKQQANAGKQKNFQRFNHMECPECGNSEQGRFVLNSSEGDMICEGYDGGGCGMVVSERQVYQGDEFRNFEGEEDKNHHGQAASEYISEFSHLCTYLGPRVGSNSRKASAGLLKIQNEIKNGCSKYGKENKKTRIEYKDQEIYKASIHFENEIASLALHPRIKDIALAHFAPYRHEVEQIKDVDKWYSACLVIGLEENKRADQAPDSSEGKNRDVAAPAVLHVVPVPVSPPRNGIKRTPSQLVLPQWVPPPPPTKKRKHSCLFHSAPTQIQRGDNQVTKKRVTDKGWLAVTIQRTPLSRTPALPTPSLAQVRTAEEVKELLYPLLMTLMEHEYGWVFNEEVDPAKLNLPNYFQIIKRPMDLGTTKAKLDGCSYQLPGQFAGDVRLTFQNAMLYNKLGSEVHTLAKNLLDHFEAEYQKALVKAASK